MPKELFREVDSFNYTFAYYDDGTLGCLGDGTLAAKFAAGPWVWRVRNGLVETKMEGEDGHYWCVDNDTAQDAYRRYIANLVVE